MTRLVIAVPFILLEVLATVRAEPDADSPSVVRDVVFLDLPDDRSHAEAIRANGVSYRGILRRELVRQAFLIAARDELGLITRDHSLGDAMPRKHLDGPFIVNLMENTDGGAVVEVAQLIDETPEGEPRLRSHTLHTKFALDDAEQCVDYVKMIAVAEEYSRTKFRDVLEKLEFRGQPNRIVDHGGVPAEVQALLAEMTFSSQFFAARKLHAEIRRAGESPQRIGALVCAYANLGVLTEYLWYPAHKLFKARALLYAQRLRVREKDSPWSRFHAAYAMALAGLHRPALEDLASAWRDWKAASQPADDCPPWVELIYRFCRFEIDHIVPDDAAEDLQQLAYLLRYLAVEHGNRNVFGVETALATLDAIPECYRVHSGLCDFEGVRISHESTVVWLVLLGQRLYPRLAREQDFGERATAAIEEGLRCIELQNQADNDDRPSFDTEFAIRAKLIHALLQTGEKFAAADEPSKAADAGNELTWASFGRLLQEMSFVQVWRRRHFEYYRLSTAPDRFHELAEPLVEGHRYKALIDAHTFDDDARDRALKALLAAPYDDLELQSQQLGWELQYYNHDESRRRVNRVHETVDYVARDLWLSVRDLTGDYRTNRAQHLLRISPYSPYARTVMIRYEWEKYQHLVDTWAKESRQFPEFLAAFGAHYLETKQFDQAQSMLEAAIRLAPDADYYELLASRFSAEGDMEQWKAVLDEFLEQPDYGLSHARIREKIARHFMSLGQWKEAEPYADGAAESGSQWGLEVAAECHEGLKNYERVDALYARRHQRYRSAVFAWYFFCRRTGTGSVDSAREAILPDLRRWEAAGLVGYDSALYYQLEGQLEKAQAAYQKLADTNNPFCLMHVILLAEERGDAAARDAAIEQLKKSPQYVHPPTGKTCPELLAVIGMLVRDLRRGGKGQIDAKTLELIRSRANGQDQMNIDYFVAKYLAMRGQTAAAKKYWTRCFQSPSIHGMNRTLAGVELLELEEGQDAANEDRRGD